MASSPHALSQTPPPAARADRRDNLDEFLAHEVQRAANRSPDMLLVKAKSKRKVLINDSELGCIYLVQYRLQAAGAIELVETSQATNFSVRADGVAMPFVPCPPTVQTRHEVAEAPSSTTGAPARYALLLKVGREGRYFSATMNKNFRSLHDVAVELSRFRDPQNRSQSFLVLDNALVGPLSLLLVQHMEDLAATAPNRRVPIVGLATSLGRIYLPGTPFGDGEGVLLHSPDCAVDGSTLGPLPECTLRRIICAPVARPARGGRGARGAGRRAGHPPAAPRDEHLLRDHPRAWLGHPVRVRRALQGSHRLRPARGRLRRQRRLRAVPAQADPPLPRRAHDAHLWEPLDGKSRHGFNLALALGAGQASGLFAGKGTMIAGGRKLSIAGGFGAVCLIDDVGSLEEGGGTGKWTSHNVAQLLHMQFGSSQTVLGTGAQQQAASFFATSNHPTANAREDAAVSRLDSRCLARATPSAAYKAAEERVSIMHLDPTTSLALLALRQVGTELYGASAEAAVRRAEAEDFASRLSSPGGANLGRRLSRKPGAEYELYKAALLHMPDARVSLPDFSAALCEHAVELAKHPAQVDTPLARAAAAGSAALAAFCVALGGSFDQACALGEHTEGPAGRGGRRTVRTRARIALDPAWIAIPFLVM